MHRNIPSFDEWLGQQKGIERGPDARYFATLDYETKDIDADDKSLVVTISTSARDRAGDILNAGGMSNKRFRRNPVVLWAHDYKGKPIAKSLWEKVSGRRIIAKPRFANTPEAQEIFSLYRDGFLNAWSVGFIPEEYEVRFKKSEDGGEEFDGYDIKKWELLEYSAVPVPCNPDALTNAYKGGKLKIESPVIKKALGLENMPVECRRSNVEGQRSRMDIDAGQFDGPGKGAMAEVNRFGMDDTEPIHSEGKTVPDDISEIVTEKSSGAKEALSHEKQDEELPGLEENNSEAEKNLLQSGSPMIRMNFDGLAEKLSEAIRELARNETARYIRKLKGKVD